MQAQWWRARHARKVTATPPVAPSATPAELAGLFDEMRELRLTLAGDLAAAAGALDAARDDVAADIIAADRRELAEFLRRSRTRLAESTTPPRPAAARNLRRRALIAIPAVPLAGALAASAAAAVGVLPTQPHAHHAVVSAPRTSAPLSSTFHQFVSVVDGDPSASQVVAAAAALHQQIAALIASAPSDPTGVGQVAQLLQMEQALLMREQPPGSAIVLAASRQLAAQLLKAAPRSLPTSTTRPTASTRPTTAPVPGPTSTPSNMRPTPTSTTSQHTWQTPPAAPTQSSTSSPSPSSSTPPTSSPGHIITIGN